MGLYDRDYMRDDEPGYFPVQRDSWSPTITLLVVLGVVFLCQWLVPRNVQLERVFGLSLNGIQHGYIWQLLTFQFLHSGFLHILLNGFTLYSLGRFMEKSLGPGRFLALYFLSGIAGGVLQIAATFLLRQKDIPVVGASAGIAGLLGAFAAMYPGRRLTILLVVFPVTVRAGDLFWILTGLSLVCTIFPFGGVAHAAHLGGILAGLAYVRLALRSQRQAEGAFDADPAPPVLKGQPPSAAELDGADFITREVDPILDKIATHGIHSLTDRERKVLDIARKKMAR